MFRVIKIRHIKLPLIFLILIQTVIFILSTYYISKKAGILFESSVSKKVRNINNNELNLDKIKIQNEMPIIGNILFLKIFK